jgi:hypothetical protein
VLEFGVALGMERASDCQCCTVMSCDRTASTRSPGYRIPGNAEGSDSSTPVRSMSVVRHRSSPTRALTWHVGLLEETLPDVTIDFEPPLLVLFDLDLYEPSAFALALLEERFKRGDILYFDEA